MQDSKFINHYKLRPTGTTNCHQTHTLSPCQHFYQELDVIQMPQHLQITASHWQKTAGLRVLIINTETHPSQTIYIQGTINNSSVLMAKATALALAALVASRLQLQGLNFLSDNKQLVSFINSSNHSTPPDWRIKYLTQEFINCNQQSNFKMFKIRRRNLNQTAYLLAKQAFLAVQSEAPTLSLELISTDFGYFNSVLWERISRGTSNKSADKF